MVNYRYLLCLGIGFISLNLAAMERPLEYAEPIPNNAKLLLVHDDVLYEVPRDLALGACTIKHLFDEFGIKSNVTYPEIPVTRALVSSVLKN